MPEALTTDLEAKQIAPGKFSNTGLLKEKANKRCQAMMNEYSSWSSTHQELQLMIYPTLGFFGNPAPNQGSKINHVELIDEEATLDVDTFSSGMEAGFTSPTRPWFMLSIDDPLLMEIPAVKWWLGDTQEILYRIFQRSNTYCVLTGMYKELATFSTACAYIDEDYETTIHIRKYTAGEYYLSRDSKGRLNGFYHRFKMTAGQMAKDFGIENCPQNVQEAYKQNNPDQWFTVHHLIEENDQRIPFLKDYKNMAYRSLYWEDSDKTDNYLRLGGYEEFPVIAPRWETRTTADVYGSGGPGWKALGAVKELQKKKKNELIGIDKATNPPVQADSTTGDINVLPGGVSRYSAQTPNAGVKPVYQVQLDLNALRASILETKQTIKKFFFADLFLMMIEAERSGTSITAFEIAERQAERVSKIGPLLELWQGDEFIQALIERTFNIALRTNQLPPVPEELAGIDIKIQYISVLAQAQKMVDILAIDQWAAGVMAEAQVNPGSLDIINFDEKNRHKAEAMGIPPKIVNSLEEMSKLRKARTQQLADAQKQAKMLSMAQAGKDGAAAVKSMSEAEMGKGSAMDAMAEQMKGAMAQ